MVRSIHQQGLRDQYEEIKKAIGIGNSSFSIVARLLQKTATDMTVDEKEADVLSDKEYTSDEKLQFLMDFRNTAERSAELVQALKTSDDPAVVKDVVDCFTSLLSIQEVFKSPFERRGAAPEIIGLFELIVNEDLAPEFVKFLQEGMYPELQKDAALCLCHIALGVRIASIPMDHPLHPSQNLFRRALVYAGAVEPLVNTANTTTSDETKDGAIHALAAIAFGCLECRDYVLKTITQQKPNHAMSTFSYDRNAPLAFDTTLFRNLEMNQMAQEAGIGVHELQQLYEMWGSSEHAQITKEQFSDGLHQIGVTDPLIIEQSFSAFDEDKSGTIDFREFVAGMAVMHRGSPEDKIALMFRAYDLDGSGFLEPDEVYAVYRTALITGGYDRSAPEIEHDALMKTVEDCFQQFDVDGDGRLDVHEFKLAVESNHIINDAVIHHPFGN